jgi:hypothetical protein
MDRDRPVRAAVSTGLGAVAFAVLLSSCGNMIAPAPDGVVWLNGCDVALVREDGLELVGKGDGFCPQTIEVDGSGVVWAADGQADVRLLGGDRWIRVAEPPSRGETPARAVDLAIGTDGRVWLAAGSGDDGVLDVEVRSFDGERWMIQESASGTRFGTVDERRESPDRILAALPGGRVALVTSEGLYLGGGGSRWIRILAGDFTTVSATPDGWLWLAGPDGVYILSPNGRSG